MMPAQVVGVYPPRAEYAQVHDRAADVIPRLLRRPTSSVLFGGVRQTADTVDRSGEEVVARQHASVQTAPSLQLEHLGVGVVRQPAPAT